MADAAVLTLYRTRVLAAWVDYNRHMNDACYGIVFSRNVDALMIYLGMDEAYRARTTCSIFTLEAHICYLHEADEDELLHVTTELLGYDSKRLHVFLTMCNDAGVVLATSEEMLLHVDISGPHATVFEAPIQDRIDRLWAEQLMLELPPQAGRSFAVLAHSRAEKRTRAQV